MSNATLITFSEQSVGTPDPTIYGVSFIGIGTEVVIFEDTFFSTLVLANQQRRDYQLAFAHPVSAFGGEFWAINDPVSIEAFGHSGSLGVEVFDPQDSRTKVFRGLGGFASPITNVVVSVTSDNIYLDNLRFVGIPEPASIVLIAIGGVLTAGRLRL